MKCDNPQIFTTQATNGNDWTVGGCFNPELYSNMKIICVSFSNDLIDKLPEQRKINLKDKAGNQDLLSSDVQRIKQLAREENAESIGQEAFRVARGRVVQVNGNAKAVKAQVTAWNNTIVESLHLPSDTRAIELAHTFTAKERNTLVSRMDRFELKEEMLALFERAVLNQLIRRKRKEIAEFEEENDVEEENNVEEENDVEEGLKMKKKLLPKK